MSKSTGLAKPQGILKTYYVFNFKNGPLAALNAFDSLLRKAKGDFLEQCEEKDFVRFFKNVLEENNLICEEKSELEPTDNKDYWAEDKYALVNRLIFVRSPDLCSDIYLNQGYDKDKIERKCVGEVVQTW